MTKRYQNRSNLDLPIINTYGDTVFPIHAKMYSHNYHIPNVGPHMVYPKNMSCRDGLINCELFESLLISNLNESPS